MKQNKGKQTVYDSQLLVKSYKILKKHFRGIWWNEVDRTFRVEYGYRPCEISLRFKWTFTVVVFFERISPSCYLFRLFLLGIYFLSRRCLQERVTLLSKPNIGKHVV